MKSLLFAALFVPFGIAIASDDVRSRVTAPPDATINAEIDPDKSVFGITFGTTENNFIKRSGKPTGYIRLNSAETVAIYGKTTAFIFNRGAFSGLLLSERIIDWKLSQSLSAVTAFDGIRWRLNNGVEAGMTLTEVKRILGPQLSTAWHQHSFRTKKALVELGFVHHTSEGDGDDAYKLNSVFIRTVQ